MAHIPALPGRLRLHGYVFLTAEDTYALRCAYLHQGSDEIGDQRIQNALERFRFVTGTRRVHCNQVNQSLQLQVEVFCEDVCAAVENWLEATADNEAIQLAIGNLMTIETIDGPFSL